VLWAYVLGGIVRLLLLSPIFLLLAGIFSLSTAFNLHAEAVSDKPIEIGAVMELTGPNAARGQLRRKGMEDYFNYMNETTSGISGHKVSLKVFDGSTELPNVLKDVENFCHSGLPAISTVCSTNAPEEIHAVFLNHRIPHIDVSNCQASLHSLGTYTYLPFEGNVLNCYAILQYIETIHRGSMPPKVGILSTSDRCGKSIQASSRAYASDHRMEIVAVEQFSPGTHDLKPAMLKFKDMGAEYILMQCSGADAVNALKSADGIHYGVPFFSSWQLVDSDFLNGGKTFNRRRTNISFPGCLPGDGTPGIHLIKILMDRYQSVSAFRIAYWEGVSIAAIMARALQKAHETLGRIDSSTVNLALETFQNEDFGGLIPNITYTDTNHRASFVTRIAGVNNDGTFMPLTTFWNPKTEQVTILP
jgi:branched-chain amino acid transport system substrate-binding protein